MSGVYFVTAGFGLVLMLALALPWIKLGLGFLGRTFDRYNDWVGRIGG